MFYYVNWALQMLSHFSFSGSSKNLWCIWGGVNKQQPPWLSCNCSRDCDLCGLFLREKLLSFKNLWLGSIVRYAAMWLIRNWVTALLFIMCQSGYWMHESFRQKWMAVRTACRIASETCSLLLDRGFLFCDFDQTLTCSSCFCKHLKGFNHPTGALLTNMASLRPQVSEPSSLY